MKNNFEKFIKDTLVGHKVDVPKQVWKNINTKKKSKWFGTLYFKSIVAVLLMCLISFPLFNRTNIDIISIDTKPVNTFVTNGNRNPLIKHIPIPTFKQEIKLNKTFRSIENPAIIIQQEEEIIVLVINPKKYRKTKPNLQSIKRTTHVINPLSLLNQIEEQILVEDKTKLEQYISKVKDFAQTDKINNTVRTAGNWVKKTLKKKNKH